LRFRRATKKLGQDLPTSRCRSASPCRFDLADRPIELLDRERCFACRPTFDAEDRRVADANSSLPRGAGEKPNCDRELARGVEPPQELGEDRDLPGARARFGYEPGGRYGV